MGVGTPDSIEATIIANDPPEYCPSDVCRLPRAISMDSRTVHDNSVDVYRRKPQADQVNSGSANVSVFSRYYQRPTDGVRHHCIRDRRHHRRRVRWRVRDGSEHGSSVPQRMGAEICRRGQPYRRNGRIQHSDRPFTLERFGLVRRSSPWHLFHPEVRWRRPQWIFARGSALRDRTAVAAVAARCE